MRGERGGVRAVLVCVCEVRGAKSPIRRKREKRNWRQRERQLFSGLSLQTDQKLGVHAGEGSGARRGLFGLFLIGKIAVSLETGGNNGVEWGNGDKGKNEGGVRMRSTER